jgi:hypothetical protein
VRYIGMDVHREFAQLAVVEDGLVRDEGRIGVTRKRYGSDPGGGHDRPARNERQHRHRAAASRRSWPRRRSNSGPRTRSTPRGRRAGPGYGHPAAVCHRRVLQVRRRPRTARPLSGLHIRWPSPDYESHATGLDRKKSERSWSPPDSALQPGRRGRQGPVLLGRAGSRPGLEAAWHAAAHRRRPTGNQTAVSTSERSAHRREQSDCCIAAMTCAMCCTDLNRAKSGR